jgi:hypothetical protein
MFADPKIRRIALTLHEAKGNAVEIHHRPRTEVGGSLILDGTIGAVDESQNSVEFTHIQYARNLSVNVRVPLDFVAGACFGSNGKWHVYLDGALEMYRTEVVFLRA